MRDPGHLLRRLEGLRERGPSSEHELVAMVHGILGSLDGEANSTDAVLLAEVRELARTLADARAEIAVLRASDINMSHIPSATDELDAIVAHTATATETILECCEQLDSIAAVAPGKAAQTLNDVTSRIYEACSFQDITGQRITKVVAALKSIEGKVAHILDVFAAQAAPSPPAPAAPNAPASLLNGPQLPANAMVQSDIDALLASFD